MNDAIAAAAPAAQEETWLLGQPPLRKYLDFVADVGLKGTMPARPELVREWSAAARYYEELETSEAGFADAVECRELDPALAPLAAELMASQRYRHTFDSLPTRIAMVEVARLVVCQNQVAHSFVQQLKQALGPDPDPESLFRFCLPLEEPKAPVEVREVGSKRYVFRSESTDLRFHEPVLLQPQQLAGYESYGTVAGVVGLVVGFSSNFLNAICDDDSGRLLLHNGYHRACALVELGIQYAPCIIQTVTSRDELDIVAKSSVAQDPGYYFNAPRPPVLKDFTDPRIRKLVPVRRMERMIEVNFDVRDLYVED